MRVLQVIPSLGLGGAERMVKNLAIRLHASGHRVVVVSLYGPLGSSVEADLRAAGVEGHFLGKKRGLDLRMVPRISRIASGFRPDVVHTHMYALKYALPSVAWRRCGVVHTIHTMAEKEVDRASRILQRVAFRALVSPVAIGDAVAESVRRVYGVVAPRTIPNGIPVSEYVPSAFARAEVRASLGIPGEAPVVVTVAAFRPEKNHRNLISAFASAQLREIGAHLMLVGDGELRATAERQAENLGLRDRVHFLGVRSDVPRLLAAGDVFALSSRYEGNPLSVMEAMAAARPVVATAVGCIPSLVGDAGLLVSPDDVNALAQALFALAGDAARSRRLGDAAARIAQQRFGDDAMAHAYEKLYEEVA